MENRTEENVNKPFYKKKWFIVLAVIVVIAAIGSSFSDAKVEDYIKENLSNDANIAVTYQDTSPRNLKVKLSKDYVIESPEILKDFVAKVYKDTNEILNDSEYSVIFLKEGTLSTVAEIKDSEFIVNNIQEIYDEQILLAKAKEEQAKKATEITTEAPTEAISVDNDEIYRAGVIVTSNRMSTILEDFSNYVSNNTDKLGTSEYTNQISIYCADLNAVISDIRNLSPTDKFKDVQADYLKAVDLYQTVADELPEAVRTLDTDKIYELTDNMNKATEFIDSATIKTKNLN